MAFEKGTSGNPTGRPEGSTNKATTAAREAIAAALAGADATKLAAHLDSLTGKDYIDAYVKLAEFVTPKLQRTAVTATVASGPAVFHLVPASQMPAAERPARGLDLPRNV